MRGNNVYGCMDKNKIPKQEVDAIMRGSYQSLIASMKRTLKDFVVMTDGDNQIEIPIGTGHRSKFIDGLIRYFEKVEEYEKCNELLKIKALVIKIGD